MRAPRRVFLLNLWLAGTTALLSGGANAQNERGFVIVAGTGYEGAIIPDSTSGFALARSRFSNVAMPSGLPSTWTPTSQDIEVVERELTRFADRMAADPPQFVALIPESERSWTLRGVKTLPGYLRDLKRHYRGFQLGDVRMVLVQFMTDSPTHWWRRSEVEGADGGCSWSYLLFNVTGGQVVAFRCGAEG
jgi:hypothetical protein